MEGEKCGVSDLVLIGYTIYGYAIVHKKLRNILANLTVHFVRAIPELTLKWQLFLLSINGWQSSNDIFMR